ncbi:unnamed protein product [Kuraishia capsulata CBS 1993]|uniref:ornithine decarboxylase n=1 Tax=Kuraishia capsulata CBS 1993 TaxID=1382522 RepID=W6MSU4_9ASCO|nr:uncharacterized protein KUCA_T00005787001 [Kuraishia capsulata CBS 1993]CDK29794.1 unnamed protein product [Kuraishia capsulata CBS 1993]
MSPSVSAGAAFEYGPRRSAILHNPKPFGFDHAAAERGISATLIDHIVAVNHTDCEPGDEDSFFVCDLSEVARLFHNWQHKLPQIKPYYAVKCNNNPHVLQVLNQLGASFDCASKGEIDTVLGLGVHPDRIVYANPCKSSSYIRYANQVGVNLTTVDNIDELAKMSRFHPHSEILLRISTDDSTAACPLSTKFGASVEDCFELLQAAKGLNLNVVGVAFHVGSGATEFSAFEKAVVDARAVFDRGISLGFNMNTLDVGGGFCLATFDESSRVLSAALNEHFPENVEFIAEPGRYMVDSAFTLACNVIAKRSAGQEGSRIYVNDGVYGNLNCIVYDHRIVDVEVLTSNGSFVLNSTGSTNPNIASVWGPTCDGLDCISAETKLAHPVEVGDWLVVRSIGAYTSSATTSFNGFKQHAEVEYIATDRNISIE